MESVITASGLSAHWDGSPETTSGISDPPLEDPGKITDRLSTLLISEEGKSRYLGEPLQAFLHLWYLMTSNIRRFIWILSLFSARTSMDLRKDWKQ